MKLAFVFVAVLAVAFAAPHKEERSLVSLVEEVKGLLYKTCSKDRYIALLQEALTTPEGTEVLEFLRGEEFTELRQFLHTKPQLKRIIDHLENSGLKVRELLQKLVELLGLPKSSIRARPIADIAADAKACVEPQQSELIELALAALSDPDVVEFLGLVSEAAVAHEYFEIKNHPVVAELIIKGDLATDGQVSLVCQLVESILGWSAGRKHLPNAEGSLRPAYEQIKKHFKVEEIKKLIAEVVSTADGKDLLAYLQTPRAQAIYKALLAEEKKNNAIGYLETHGLENTRTVIREILTLLGLDYSRKSPAAAREIPPALISLIEELKKLIDTEGLLETVVNLLEDKDVQELLAFLSGANFKASYQKIKNLPETQSLIADLLKDGVDVQPVLDIVEALLNWGI